jgi:signal transduction histidine kinase/DNA-binding response OmpR family regulator
MVESVAGLRQHISLSPDQLLFEGESILIVDDDPLLRDPLRMYLEGQNLAVEEADSAASLMRMLEEHHIALVLLDIGLPDMDGRDVLPNIVVKYPNVAIVMLTGVADLQVALECIREGADDFLSKPVQFNEILFVVKKVLEKRRLIFENRKYQEDLETAHFRIRLLHQLSIKMNTVYLSTTELDEILLAILVGITANEGLRFNRAFLALFDEAETVLQGRLAIGPSSREDAHHIWSEMSNKQLNFFDLVHSMKESCVRNDLVVNKITKALRVSREETDNILIRSTIDRRSVLVSAENKCIPELIERRETRANGGDALFLKERRKDFSDKEDGQLQVPEDLIQLLREDTFVVVPLYSPRRSFGVILADNFVTKAKITDTHISSLELFASQASLAIEHSHLYTDMQKTIRELEVLNHEIDKNKDQLIATERYSALGHMSAQLVHAIRNPITSIGGVARILEKKITNEEWQKYIRVMIKETGRLESTLEDLFDFVSHAELHKQKIPLYTLLKKTMLLLQSDLTKQKILWEVNLKEPEPHVNIDEKQVRQMFLHLLKNSIEAMPGGGNLTIEAHILDKVVQVSILDTGIGIHDTHLDKAKDPFFTTKTYGTGMGLTMVDRIVKAHDGSFTMQKRETGGMEVNVYFPIVE